LIQVLQEVAAARNVLIMCGHDEINGYKFCDALRSFKGIIEADPDLQDQIRPVTYSKTKYVLSQLQLTMKKDNPLRR
jgi:hypothetical protein